MRLLECQPFPELGSYIYFLLLQSKRAQHPLVGSGQGLGLPDIRGVEFLTCKLLRVIANSHQGDQSVWIFVSL